MVDFAVFTLPFSGMATKIVFWLEFILFVKCSVLLTYCVNFKNYLKVSVDFRNRSAVQT